MNIAENAGTNTAENTDTAEAQTAAGAIREITDASRQMFEAGERVARNMEALERRLEHATDLRAQLAERPWLLVGGVIVAGILLWRILR